MVVVLPVLCSVLIFQGLQIVMLIMISYHDTGADSERGI